METKESAHNMSEVEFTAKNLKLYRDTLYNAKEDEYKFMVSNNFKMDLYLQCLQTQSIDYIRDGVSTDTKEDGMFIDLPPCLENDVKFFSSAESFKKITTLKKNRQILETLIKDELEERGFELEFNCKNSNQYSSSYHLIWED